MRYESHTDNRGFVQLVMVADGLDDYLVLSQLTDALYWHEANVGDGVESRPGIVLDHLNRTLTIDIYHPNPLKDEG